MLVSGIEILELIPQRPPMVMVDNLVLCEGPKTVTTLKISDDNIFASENGFSAPGILETMAQTAALRTGFLLKRRPGGENKKAPIGVIGSIKNFKLYFQPATGNEIITIVEVQYEIMQATIVSARVEAEGKLAAEAEMQIFLTESES